MGCSGFSLVASGSGHFQVLGQSLIWVILGPGAIISQVVSDSGCLGS